MKTVNEVQALNISDNNPSTNRDFNDISKYMWKDNLPFNIFTEDGVISEDAKAFVKEHGIKRKSFDETWGDAILNYAERYEFGYQVSKAPQKRSSVKFSGSMIMSAYLEDQDAGREYRAPKIVDNLGEGIDLTEQELIKSYR